MGSPQQTQSVFVECQASGCASVLQVVVPSTHRQGKGEVLVRCGKCHRLLRVQLPPELLEPTSLLPDLAAHETQPSLAPMSRPGQLQHPSQAYSQSQQQGMAAGPSVSGQGVRRRRPPSAYHDWISQEMKRLKASHPGLDHQAAFKIAASSWVTSGAKAASDHAKQQLQTADHFQDTFTPQQQQQQQQQQYQAATTPQPPGNIRPDQGAMQQQYHDTNISSSHGGSTFHMQAQELQGGGAAGVQYSSSIVQPPLGAGGANLASLLMPIPQGVPGAQLAVPAAPPSHQLQVQPDEGGYGGGVGDGGGAGDGGGGGSFAQQAGSSAPQSSAIPGLAVADGSQRQDGRFEQQAGQAFEGGPAAAAEAWPAMVGEAYGSGSAAMDSTAAGSPSTPADAGPLQPHMPPPAARDANNNSEAACPSLQPTPAPAPAAATIAAIPQSQHTAGTQEAPATPPAAAAASADGTLPTVVSSSQVQLNRAPLTLQETWETLCQQTAPQPPNKVPHDGVPEQPGAVAEVRAATAVQGGDSCRPNIPPTILPHAQITDGAHQQQQQNMQPVVHLTTAHLTPLQQAPAQQKTPFCLGAVPPSGPAAGSGSTRALVSEGSSLASWQSSGGLGPQPAGEQSVGYTASPDPGSSQSGAAGSSVPAASILRHNSAPITTSLGGVVCLPHSRGKTPGYSITTAGPTKPARG